MKSHLNRRRLLWALIVLLSVLVLFLEFGCTARDEAAAKKAGGTVATIFGLPPIVGESLVGLALAASHMVTAKVSHARGRKKERAGYPTQPPKASA